MWTVYQHINKINGKRYIGITCRKVEDRWQCGMGYKTQPFYRAIQKCGWDGFEHIIVKSDLPEQCAKTLEKILIFKYDTNNPINGYNITNGGDGICGYVHSKEAKLKMSKAKKGVSLINSGSFIKGHSPWNKGLTYNANTRNRKITKYSLDGDKLETYRSLKDAAKSVNGSSPNLRRAIKKTGTYKNYIWIYE